MTATHQQILTTAGQLFADRGYELVGINEIIEKSGVAKATFYSNFKSKESLCAAWMRSTAAQSEKAGSELLKKKITAAEKVALKFDLLKQYVQASDFRGCPFSTTASMIEPTSEVCQIIRDYKANSRCFWQSLALEVRRDPGEARALGDTLFLLFSGAVTEAQNARHTWPVDSAKEAALALCNTTPES
jgi:AcrR family transcriptional regulator